jgi:hypothetical protein
MPTELAYPSTLATLMGRVFPTFFSQVAPNHGPAQPLQFYPPGLSRWDPQLGDQKPSKAAHCWTGNYVATFLVATTKLSNAQSALRKGMSIDPKLVLNGSYPVVLGFGTFENARSTRYSFLGLNYTEFLAAIPRVFMQDPKYPYQGPYLYPYRLYLNRLMPTIFGRLSGYPKHWERVSLVRTADTPNSYMFKVGKLLTGETLLELNFTVAPDFHNVRHFPRLSELSRLLIPNIVATGLFNIPIRTFFELDLPNAIVWNVPAASLRIADPSLLPLLPRTYTWEGIQQERYGAVRLYLPWKLTSADDPDPSFMLSVGSGNDDHQDIQAAS